MSGVRWTYVAAADTGVADVDEDIVGVLEGRDGAVFEFDFVNAFEDEGEVLWLIVSSVLYGCVVLVSGEDSGAVTPRFAGGHTFAVAAEVIVNMEEKVEEEGKEGKENKDEEEEKSEESGGI
jgi:hypothetical protein